MYYCIILLFCEDRDLDTVSLACTVLIRLTKTYITEGNYRKYRITLGTIFETLTRNDSQQRDVNKIAKEQFGGKGSFGVYGAARASPVALFYARNLTDAIEVRSSFLMNSVR